MPSITTWWLLPILWTQVMCDACWGRSLLWAKRLRLHISWNQFCCSAKTSLSHSQMPNTPWRISHPQWQAVYLVSEKEDVLFGRIFVFGELLLHLDDLISPEGTFLQHNFLFSATLSYLFKHLIKYYIPFFFHLKRCFLLPKDHCRDVQASQTCTWGQMCD